jgi:hypothetical protein
LDEVLLDVSRPVILTGIVDVVTRADLADRALAIKLEPIEETKRRSERELMAAFSVRATSRTAITSTRSRSTPIWSAPPSRQ